MIGCSFVIGRGLSRLDEGQKVGGILLFHFFGGSLLDSFLMIGCSSSCRFQFRFILDDEGSLVEVLVCQAATWTGHMEGLKLTTYCYFLLLCYFGELLLEVF